MLLTKTRVVGIPGKKAHIAKTRHKPAGGVTHKITALCGYTGELEVGLVYNWRPQVSCKECLRVYYKDDNIVKGD